MLLALLVSLAPSVALANKPLERIQLSACTHVAGEEAGVFCDPSFDSCSDCCGAITDNGSLCVSNKAKAAFKDTCMRICDVRRSKDPERAPKKDEGSKKK